jgi:aspartate/glutamate racemase
VAGHTLRVLHIGILGHSTDGYLRDGCDAVALSCTEIPLIVTPKNSPLPTLDSTRLLARAAVDVALGEAPAPTWRGGPL